MAEEIKVTEKELESIKNIQNEYNKKIVEFGQLRIQILDITEKLKESQEIEDNLIGALKELRESENKLAKELSDKYGTGKLDTNTGIFQKME